METVPQRSAYAAPGKPRRLSRVISALRIAGVIVSIGIPSAAAPPRRPNIVIILGDDMGFSDMGSFGSEIRTPNLDLLAKDGVRFTNFYTNASCSPTRSVLLSGVDTHLNGLGNMDEWTAPNQQWSAWLRGLSQQPGGDAAAVAQRHRLPHLHGRQVASGQGSEADPGGARIRARFLAARRSRQLLGHDELHRLIAALCVH